MKITKTRLKQIIREAMDFNSRHGAGREGRIGEIVLQILRDM